MFNVSLYSKGCLKVTLAKRSSGIRPRFFEYEPGRNEYLFESIHLPLKFGSKCKFVLFLLYLMKKNVVLQLVESDQSGILAVYLVSSL